MIIFKTRKLPNPAHIFFPLHCTISPIPSFCAYDLEARWVFLYFSFWLIMVSYLIRCLLSVQIFIHIYFLKVLKYFIFYFKKIMSIFYLFFLGYVLSFSNFGILYDGISSTFTFIGLRYDFFFFWGHSIIKFWILFASFLYHFFIVSDSRIKFYFILDLSFAVGKKKSQAKFDSNTCLIKVWSFCPHFVSFFILSFHFCSIAHLIALPFFFSS